MFIYSFQTKGNFLIKHLVISANHITIYTSHAHSSALQPVINHFKLGGTFADSSEHRFLHHPYVHFSSLGDELPHKHLKFHKPNRLQALKEILNFLLNRQNNPRLRKKDFLKLRQDLNAERMAYGHKVFPENIQQALNTYNNHTPFFPAEELSALLDAFSRYLQSDSLLNYADNLVFYAEYLFHKHWDFLYSKLMFAEAETLKEIHLKNYYDDIVDLRHLLLKITTKAEAVDYYYIITIAENILKNPYMEKIILFNGHTIPLAENLKLITAHAANFLKSLERKSSIYFAGLASAGVAITDIYALWSMQKWGESQNISLKETRNLLLHIGAVGFLSYHSFKPLALGLASLSTLFRKPKIPVASKDQPIIVIGTARP